ncbi:hypothetical protein XPA_009046 [Xanthoria parietina]
MRLHLGVCVLFVLLLATLTVALVLEATDALRLNKATAWFYCRIFVDTSAFKRQPIHYGVTATTRAGGLSQPGMRKLHNDCILLRDRESNMRAFSQQYEATFIQPGCPQLGSQLPKAGLSLTAFRQSWAYVIAMSR